MKYAIKPETWHNIDITYTLEQKFEDGVIKLKDLKVENHQYYTDTGTHWAPPPKKWNLSEVGTVKFGYLHDEGTGFKKPHFYMDLSPFKEKAHAEFHGVYKFFDAIFPSLIEHISLIKSLGLEHLSANPGEAINTIIEKIEKAKGIMLLKPNELVKLKEHAALSDGYYLKEGVAYAVEPVKKFLEIKTLEKLIEKEK